MNPIFEGGPTIQEIDDHIAAGYVRESRIWLGSPRRILSYTHKAVNKRHWNTTTMHCRGLILDGERVIARPFKKFFNIGEYGPTPTEESYEITEKMDGSLGILYFLDGEPHIATRGSFTGRQSALATAMAQKKYNLRDLDNENTYLFEIIDPDTRIVVNYWGNSELVLIGIINKETGQDVPLPNEGSFPTPVVPRYSNTADLETLASQNRPNHEGYVVRFVESGLRLKIKHPEYVRLHRMVTGVTPRMVWDVLKSGGSADALTDSFLPVYSAWVRETAAEIQGAYDHIQVSCRRHFAERPIGADRKAIAAHFATHAYPAVLFAMLDDKPYRDYIWRAVMPRANWTYRKDVE